LRRRFEDEVAPLRSTLQRVARQWSKNADDAEDLVQDTMVRAYSGFPAVRSRTHMKAWFIRIMRNIWIDDYRRGQRRPTECLTGDVGDWQWDGQCRNALQRRDAVEGLLIETTLQAEVRDASRSVPEDLRRALYYAYVEGRPYKEIARLESIPLGTVMSRRYRTRRNLVAHRLGDTQTSRRQFEEELALARSFAVPITVGIALRRRASTESGDVALATLREAVASAVKAAKWMPASTLLSPSTWHIGAVQRLWRRTHAKS
jgi:RNA polymerase sigma-70 factor, ECF subfamily